MGVEDLVRALEEQTEPHAAWNLAKEDVQKGTGTTAGKADYAAGTKGPELVDTVNAFAKDFYGAMGKGGNMDPEQLGHQLRIDLGDNYGPFRNALKIGDVDEVNKLAKDALVNRYGAAKITPVIEKISLLSPEERLAVGKQLVDKVGGTDYVRAATDPGGILQALSQMKLTAEKYAA